MTQRSIHQKKVHKTLVKQSVVVDFFGRRVGVTVALTGASNSLGQETSGVSGAPAGILGALPTSHLECQSS